MLRFLLALSLLVTLSACRPGEESERGTGNAPDTTAAEGAVTTGNWTLPWYYLAAPVCLVGGTAPSHSALVDSLVALSHRDSTEFRNVLLDTSPQVSLIDRIHGIVDTIATGYRWDTTWAAKTNGQLAVRVRSTPSSQNVVFRRETQLWPDALVLPWPFPNDTNGELAARAAALSITIPTAPTVGANGFYLDRLLAVGDTIVTKDRQSIPDPTNEGQVRDTILARVRKHPVYTMSAAPFPASLRMSVNTSWPTDSTEVRYLANTVPGGQVHIVLGWTEVKNRVFYAEWPCDALK